MRVHPTAIVSKKAEIADDVKIGPYSIIEDEVAIGAGAAIGSHVYIHGGTTIGRDSHIHNGVILGDEPQDLAFKGEKTFLQIGDRNTFREYVTIHRGTKEGSSTLIGNDNYLMAFSHIAHNCQIADNIIICNNSLLGGYVAVEDKAFISAACLIHQFVRVGTLSFIAGGVRLSRDLPPYMVADVDNVVSSFNLVGLRRTGINAKARAEIKEAFRLIYRSGLNLSNALAEIEKAASGGETRDLVDFIKSSKRGICFSRSNRKEETQPAQLD